MGKGSSRRPLLISEQEAEDNWNRIFKQKPHEGQFDGRQVTDTANTSETSEGKLSAYILIGLPILLAAVLIALNRAYISLLWTTKIGIVILVMAAIMMIVGILWILKIIKIDY